MAVKPGFISEPDSCWAPCLVGLVVRLHKLGLLPEANRRTLSLETLKYFTTTIKTLPHH
jgi:hypothetical protein